jgi:5-methylcytosine-specific restriction protein A
MPSRPPHPCGHPGCPKITHERFCPVHMAEHKARERARLANRPSAAARGYDSEWKRIRNAHIEQEPHCRMCLARGRVVPATVVDHRLAIMDGGDHNPENLQSLCTSCHRSKTRRATDERAMRRGQRG